jgi:hypothetical protein
MRYGETEKNEKMGDREKAKSNNRCCFDPWKKSGSGSGMNISDHFSESLETVFFGVLNTQIL